MKKHILIIDDDALLRRSVAFSLEKAGYITSTASSAEDALTIIQKNTIDLILLDISLPGGIDGLEALKMFQNEKSIPIIFVTARRRELDEVLGLELGADDYITKPFDKDVLLAHIRAVLRRFEYGREKLLQEPVVVGDIRIDPTSHEAYLGDNSLELSPREFDILLLLMENANHVISVSEILNRIWGPNWIGETQTIYVHMRWLREKIEVDAAHPQRIITVKGVGYKIVSPVGQD